MRVLWLLAFAFPVWPETILLPVGKTHDIPVTEKTAIHIGSKAMLAAVDLGHHVRLIGKKVGETHLLAGKTSYLVEVISPATARFAEQLRSLLKDKQGLSVSFKSGNLEITGQLLRFEDWQDVADLAQSQQVTYQFAARPLPDVATRAVARFAEMAKKNGLPQLRLLTDGLLVVSLPAGADDYVPLAEKTFAPYGIGVRITPSQVKIAPLIRTHVILAGVSRDMERDFGVNWPDTYQAKVLPKFEAPTDVSTELQALESKGHAKILASPNLLCRSGSEADFLAGGEFPIRTSKFFAGEVLWKKHGVILKIKPLADASGSISLDIETEISVIDKSNAIEGIPALLTNRVHSHFDLAGRKTIALSGLLRNDWNLNYKGVAGLASIPLLGALFRMQSFKENRIELVVFVTPEVVPPEADGDPIEMPQHWADDDF